MNIKESKIAELQREIKRLRKMSIKQKKKLKELEEKNKEKDTPSLAEAAH